MTKRVKDEVIGIVACLVSAFISIRLIHNIESMSIAFKTEPAYRLGAAAINLEVVLVLLSYLFRMLPLLIWLISIKRRMLQGSVRRYLEMAVYTALIFVTNSYLQHATFVTDFMLHRVTGNLVVLVLLYFPLFSFYAALCIGKDPDYKLHRGWFLLLIPVAVLTILSMTNELHFWMFYRMPDEGLNFLFHLNIGMYLCVAWSAICFLAMLFVFFRRGNEVKEAKVLRYMPMVLAALFVFLLTKFLEASFAMEMEILEAPMGFFMLVAFTWECMIFSGMIQANFYHVQMFHQTGVPIAIVDDQGGIYDQSMAFEQEDLQHFDPNRERLELQDGYVYLSNRIHGGYVFWKKDVREFEELRTLLEKNKSKLLGDAQIAKQEIALSEDEERQHIQEKMYLKLSGEIDEEIQRLKESISRYDAKRPEYEKLSCLNEINILMVYIKRYIYFFFIREMEQSVTDMELLVGLQDIKEVFSNAGIENYMDVHFQGEICANFVLVGMKTWVLVLEYFDFLIERLEISFTKEDQVQKMTVRMLAPDHCFVKGTKEMLLDYIHEKHGDRLKECMNRFECSYDHREIVLEME